MNRVASQRVSRVIRLTATAATVFLGWTGCGAPDGGADEVVLSASTAASGGKTYSARHDCPKKPVTPEPGSCDARSGWSSHGHKPRTITIASCTGVDDTAAIRDALAHADEVHLPAGTCVTAGLSVELRPIKLVGAGREQTILKYRADAGDNCLLFANGGPTEVADMTFDGQRDAGADVCGLFVRPKTCVGAVKVTNVAFRNFTQTALIVSGDGTGTVNGVVDDRPGVGAQPVIVTDTVVLESENGIAVGTSSIPNLAAVQIRRNTVSVDTGAAIAIRGLANGNVADNQTSGGSAGVLLESGDFDVTVTDNDIAGCTVGGVVLGGGGLNVGSNILVQGNHVTGCANGVAVVHMSYGRYENVRVVRNRLLANSHAGLMVTTALQLAIVENELVGNGFAGVDVEVAPQSPLCGDRCLQIDDLNITANTFRAGPALTSAGLYFANATARDVRVTGNDLRADAPVPPYQPMLVAAPPADGELTFDGNQGWPTITPAP